MLDGIEALIALEKFGTVSEAATRLRLTQSAVSKRIHALQSAVGYKLVEPHGRRIRLTGPGIRLLERARPLVAELRALATPADGQAIASLSIVMADSIAASWGPAVIRRALESVSGIALDLHAHRSVLLIESLRLGRYHIGLSTDIATARDLIRYPVIDEPMVLVNCGCARKASAEQPVITIEQGSATWRAMEAALRKEHPDLYRRPRIGVESFSAAVQMVRAKFGDGLVPLGLARELKLDARCYRVVDGLVRKVALYTRKTVNQTPTFARFREALTREAAALFR
ncbi:MAG: LysR family transcriptional regulator [Rhodospirillaceae bacterium]